MAHERALCCRSALDHGPRPLDPVLAMLVEVWPDLTAEERLAIAGIAAAAGFAVRAAQRGDM